MYNKTLNLFLFLLFLTSFTACVNFNDFEGLEVGDYEGEFAVPLFQSAVSFQQLLNDLSKGSDVLIEPDGSMLISYFQEPQIRRTEDIFAIIPIFGALLTDTTNTIPFELPEEMDIQIMTFDKGDIAFNFKSFHEDDLTVTFILPQLSRNGQVFKRTFSVDYTGTLPVEKTGVFSLTNQSFMPENDSLIIQYVATHNATGVRDTLSNVQMGVVNLEFSYADGFLGTASYDVDSASITLDFFNTLSNSSIYLDDPRIIIRALNSFGFPVRSDTRKLVAVTSNGTTIPIENEAVVTGINFNFPTFDEIGETKITTYVLNKNNSNLLDVIAARPAYIEYVIDVVTNPDDVPLQTGFLTDSSIFSAQIGVEIPIVGSVTDYLARDTFEVSFESFNNIKEMEFKVIAENEIPLTAALQIYFTDKEGNVLDSLFSDFSTFIEAAQVDNDGNPMAPAISTTLIPVNADKFLQIKNAGHLITSTRFSTRNEEEGPVRFNALQSLRIRSGIKAVYQE